MIEEISIDKKNEVYMLVQAEPGIEQEIREYFSFFIPVHRYPPSETCTALQILYLVVIGSRSPPGL